MADCFSAFKDLQVSWDPGGTENSPSAWGQPETQEEENVRDHSWWAVIWALGLLLVKYSPGLPVVSYKSAEAAAGRPSNELSNIVILLPSFTVHLHFQVFLSVSCSSFLLCSDLPSPKILYLACYLNRVGLLTSPGQ